MLVHTGLLSVLLSQCEENTEENSVHACHLLRTCDTVQRNRCSFSQASRSPSWGSRAVSERTLRSWRPTMIASFQYSAALLKSITFASMISSRCRMLPSASLQYLLSGTLPAYLGKPTGAHLGTAAQRVGPDGREGGCGAVVVGDCNSQVQIQHCVPPPAWDIHCFSRALHCTEACHMLSGRACRI